MDTRQIAFFELFNRQIQYTVPRWQRRYCWTATDIERLVEDLTTVADGHERNFHYGGAIITWQPGGLVGIVPRLRLVDGQQRLSTASMLLAHVARALKEKPAGTWTPEAVTDLLVNRGPDPETHRKLKLQDGDDEAWTQCLRMLEHPEADPEGMPDGAIGTAWRMAGTQVEKVGADTVMRGLSRLKVVSIELRHEDDAQQIYESLNATGRPLAESEKVRNFVLMGLDDRTQKHLHETHWLAIEALLATGDDRATMDHFLRDVMRTRTGALVGKDKTYAQYRREHLRKNISHGQALETLHREARAYACVLGTRAAPTPRSERTLKHLRTMGTDVHHPLALRLLLEAEREREGGQPAAWLDDVLERVAAWLTRRWLAGMRSTGMNRTMIDLAHGARRPADADRLQWWTMRIGRLSPQANGVPDDEAVRNGIAARSTAGASNTRAALAVLTALMETERPDEAPRTDALTVEHVMPRTLTPEWRARLGPDAETVHQHWCERLANLTLAGAPTNASLSNRNFDEKRRSYASSPIGMTRDLAAEHTWNEATLERRGAALTEQVLRVWPWKTDPARKETTHARRASVRWRIGPDDWHGSNSHAQMTLEVAQALLDRNPANGAILASGSAQHHLRPADRYPPRPYRRGQGRGRTTVPGHGGWTLVMNWTRQKAVEAVREWAEKCGTTIEVDERSTNGKGPGPSQKNTQEAHGSRG